MSTWWLECGLDLRPENTRLEFGGPSWRDLMELVHPEARWRDPRIPPRGARVHEVDVPGEAVRAARLEARWRDHEGASEGHTERARPIPVVPDPGICETRGGRTRRSFVVLVEHGQ